MYFLMPCHLFKSLHLQNAYSLTASQSNTGQKQSPLLLTQIIGDYSMGNLNFLKVIITHPSRNYRFKRVKRLVDFHHEWIFTCFMSISFIWQWHNCNARRANLDPELHPSAKDRQMSCAGSIK